ncbi:MAG: LCP family protein [Kibdelosporangium sp.]
MNEEALVRQAIAAEAEQAVDPGIVLAHLRQGRKPRRHQTKLVAVAGLAVAAAVVAVVVPLAASRDEAPPGASVASGPAAKDQNILLIGVDSRDHADAIVLTRVGTDGSVRAVSLPRDTRSEPGVRLNAVYGNAFTAAEQSGSDPVAAGTGKLMTAVKDLTGVQPDSYAIVEMAGFAELSSAVGGVDVCLLAASKDRFDPAVTFPAGRQSLSGAKALAFLRHRGMPGGDLDRVVRQQAFLENLVTKLAGDPGKLAAIAAVVRSKVVAGPGLDLVELAKRLTRQADVSAATIPVIDEPEKDGMLSVDQDKVRRFTADFLAGTRSSAAQEPGTAAGTPPPGDVACVR